VYLETTALFLSGCEFSACSTDASGGALSVWHGLPSIVECDFVMCEAAWLGGAIDCRFSPCTIDRCTFYECEAVSGCAIICANASPSITRCTVMGGVGVPAIRCHNLSQPTIEYVTIARAPSGIYADSNSYPTIRNTVVAFSTDYRGFYCDGLSTMDVTHCVSYGNADSDSLPGTHYDNLFVDPLFCGMAYYDFSHCANSVCLPGNNGWGESIGALEQGCDACGSPVERTSWGAIKAMYR